MKKDKNNYSPEAVKKNRTFPLKNTFFLGVILILQIGCILFGCIYEPKPQDRIDSYSVTVYPRENGTLDITYDIVWTALDENEELSWVSIGMANPNYRIYTNTLSDTIASAVPEYEDGYVGLRLNFKDSYSGGESVHFSFSVNQGDVICRGQDSYFFEYVPGWFNRIPVTHYEFNWENSDAITSVNTKYIDTFCTWSGALDCGGYQVMKVRYNEDAFNSPHPVPYKPFEDDGAYNDLESDKAAAWFVVICFCFLGLIAEFYIVDSYVSYRRGRGFLTGYGHHVHVYGRVNPHYRVAHSSHVSRSGGGGGRGCACACACACAGGGRAGCSQKDTYGKFSKKEKKGT